MTRHAEPKGSLLNGFTRPSPDYPPIITNAEPLMAQGAKGQDARHAAMLDHGP